MVVTSTNNYFFYGIACAECNHRLIAPNWWEYVSEHPIRHSWSCESAVTSSKHPSICGLIHPLLPERWGPGIVPKLVTV
jgi:hypothetical protein